MDRFVRNGTGDYYPITSRNQYKFFNPTPVLPLVSPGWTYDYPSCQSRSNSICRHFKNIHDSTTTWCKIDQHPLQSTQMSRLHSHSINKLLPWRASTGSLNNKCSCYTGREMNYGDAYILGTENTEKFKNLATSSNISAAHASRTYTWNPTKYSPRDWNYNNNQLCAGVNCVHDTVTMLQQETEKCIDHTGKEQLRCSNDTSDEITKRLQEMEVWTKKLQDELNQNIVQTHELAELRERIQKVQKNIAQPLEVSKETQRLRNGRPGVELVRDAVEEALSSEVQVFIKSTDKLKQERRKVEESMKRLRIDRIEIEIDIRNKEIARDADECAKILSDFSHELGPPSKNASKGFHHQFIPHSSPITWLQHTQALIQKSREERIYAQVLSVDIAREMLKIENTCFGNWYNTNSAIKVRIAEIIEAKRRLQLHLRKVMSDISSVRKHLENVKNAIDSKMPQLQLAENRIDKREERPGLELCRDQATITLLKEIHTLRSAIDVLTTKHAELETTLKHLLKTKSTLERDIKLKNIALVLDQDKVLDFRKTFPISTFQQYRHGKHVHEYMAAKIRESKITSIINSNS